jgi:hypothetical protein
MNIFLVTFAFMLTVVGMMAIGVMFGRRAIKGSCGGVNSDCVCVEKCDKRKKWEAENGDKASDTAVLTFKKPETLH